MSHDDAPRIFTPEYYARMRLLESESWWNAGMRDIAGALLRQARLPSQGTLLDVGCGSGQTMSWFLCDHAGWAAVGIDVSSDAVTAARASGHAVMLGRADATPIPDASVDLVISLDVLQHLPLDGGDNAAFVDFLRVLKPGGTLLIRTNAQSFPRLPEDPVNDYRRYDPRDLRAKLVKAGFEIVSFGRANALLGLAEIPREIRARRSARESYQGILSTAPASRGIMHRLKRGWLALEGGALRRGWQLPLGRTIFALCRAPTR